MGIAIGNLIGEEVAEMAEKILYLHLLFKL